MLKIENSLLRAEISPAKGARILRLEFDASSRGWVPLLRPADPENPGPGGCFPMLPFANRIVGGAFTFEGVHHQVPMNRPAENLAIHGPARERPWQVVAAGPSHCTLALTVDDYPWPFAAEQDIRIHGRMLIIELRLTNIGTATMPFGMGLHPWFTRSPDARLILPEPASQRQDASGLPIPGRDPRPEFARDSALPLMAQGPIDATFPDQDRDIAALHWPGPDVRLKLRGKGALRHLHVYQDAARDAFCVEPVSHLPDAVNRPDLPAMDRLAPGESLHGMMLAEVSQGYGCL